MTLAQQYKRLFDRAREQPQEGAWKSLVEFTKRYLISQGALIGNDITHLSLIFTDASIYGFSLMRNFHDTYFHEGSK